jgi:D-lyxose ketol-isomerase
VRRESEAQWRAATVDLLRHAGVVIGPNANASIEIADMGIGDFESEGLGVLIYVNCERYCAKELVMLPGQTCPEHRHPPVGDDPGKQETFRVRYGTVYLHVEGEPTPSPVARAPRGKAAWYTAPREIVLRAGEQFTIPPDTAHWFQAGPEGAVVSEFSSTSRDELDVFTDPAVRRVPAGGRRANE